MTAVTEREAIGTLFRTAWIAGSNTPVAYPNREFDIPNGVPWVRLHYEGTGSFPIEVGHPGQHRFNGIVFVQVFAPIGKGDGPALTLADEAAAIFRNETVLLGADGRIIFRTPTIRQIGKTEDDWYQVNVSCPFFRDEFF